MEESNPELESFRQKWREEVSQKSKGESSKAPNAGSSRSTRRPQAAPRLATDKVVKPSAGEDDHLEPQASHGLDGTSGGPGHAFGESSNSRTANREPRSALEHYEKAVERETQGRLGDSLDLYRKAFKVSIWTGPLGKANSNVA